MLEPTEQNNPRTAACQCQHKIKGLLRLAGGFMLLSTLLCVTCLHFSGGFSLAWIYTYRLDVFMFLAIVATPVLLFGGWVWLLIYAE